MSKMAFGADLGIFGSQQALEAMWYASRLASSHLDRVMFADHGFT